MATATSSTSTDERVKEMSLVRKALIRPELGGICGTVLVFVFFLLFAFDSGMFNSQGIMNWSIVSPLPSKSQAMPTAETIAVAEPAISANVIGRSARRTWAKFR